MDPLILLAAAVILALVIAIPFILTLPQTASKTSLPPLADADFIPTQMYREPTGMGGIAVNEQTQQICLLQHAGTPPRLLPLTDLLGTVLLKNGERVHETFRTSPADVLSHVSGLRKTISPYIASHIGSDSTHSNQRIDLLIAIGDEDDPLHHVNFLDMDTKEGGIFFEKAFSTGNYWFEIIHSLILKADHRGHIQGQKPAHTTSRQSNGQ